MMMKFLVTAFVFATVTASTENHTQNVFSRVIVHEPNDDFAARELARYVYVATGTLPITQSVGVNDDVITFVSGVSKHNEVIAIVRPQSQLTAELSKQIGIESHLKLPTTKGSHVITSKKISEPESIGSLSAITLIAGNDSTAVLYGVYSTVEQLGIRFELHGDIIPDPTAAGGLPLRSHAFAVLPLVSSTGFDTTPTFDYRGLQPFHDFPEGPDWWDTDHYKLINSQIAKMKMNFLGLHTYPFKNGLPRTGSDEPTVWVGGKEGLEADGSVKLNAAYPTSYANTMRNEWGYAPLNTSGYSWGTANIFETDCWATYPTTQDSCPYPSTPEAQVGMFERTVEMLEAAFAWGKTLGVESCVGTETPLSYPLPPPPPLPVCEVVGPTTCYKDTTARILPNTVSISDQHNDLEWCASRCSVQNSEGSAKNLTVAGVEYGVACFCGYEMPTGAQKLPDSACDAIPCAGNPGETCGASYIMKIYKFKCSPAPPNQKQDEKQLKAENVTRATEVYEGIFTRLLKKMPSLTWYWVWTPEAWEWGHMNSNNPIFTNAVADLGAAMAARDSVNPNLKMATNGWVVGPLPDRTIFDKTLPGTWDAITSIDMNTGHSAVDPAYANVTRHPKWAIPWMEDDPDLSAPQLWVNRTLMHMEDAARYNCSGLLGIHWRTRATGPQISAMAQKSWSPTLTSQGFWADWASIQFGSSGVTTQGIAAIFEGIDSFKMPLVVTWKNGPGSLSPGCGPTSTFAFVEALAAFGPQINGAMNQDRFNYWVATFRYMKAIRDFSCSWSHFNTAFTAAKNAVDPATRKQILENETIPARLLMIANATKMMTQLQLTLSNPGELGTYMNIESRSLVGALTVTGQQLSQLMQAPLPSTLMPPTTFGSTARLIVPTSRSALAKGEPLNLRALLLASSECSKVEMNVRPMGGGGAFTVLNFINAGRAVFTIELDAQSGDFEYYVSAKCGNESPVYPRGAPMVTQTVVLQ